MMVPRCECDSARSVQEPRAYNPVQGLVSDLALSLSRGCQNRFAPQSSSHFGGVGPGFLVAAQAFCRSQAYPTRVKT